MRFSDKIILLRKQRGWSQEELANQLDVSRQAIYKWEAGLTTPELEKIKKLTEIFDTSFEELLNDEKEVLLIKKEAEPAIKELGTSELLWDDETGEQSQSTAFSEEPSEEAESEQNMTGNEGSAESLSPKRKSRVPFFIAIGIGALATFVIFFILILHFCVPIINGGKEPPEDESSLVSENGCTIEIVTGESENTIISAELTQGKSFNVQIPSYTSTCVVFKGYFSEDGVQVTDSLGNSVVKYNGEKIIKLYPHYQYIVRTAEELVALQNFAPVTSVDTYKNVTIELANDIDLSAIKDWEPLRIYPCFDGKSHKIKNLTSSKGGLFADIYGKDEKYIKNVTLENVNITVTKPIEGGNDVAYIGAVAGWFQGSIENVTVSSGKISISKNSAPEIEADGIAPYARSKKSCVSKAVIEIK